MLHRFGQILRVVAAVRLARRRHASQVAEVEPAVEEVSMSKPKPVEVETPKKLGNTEKSSKVKGAQSAVESDSTATKKKTKKAKTVKKSKKSSTAAPKAATETKKRTKKTIVVSKADWKSLSESTLKRKTVKELTGYLSDKVRAV